MNHLKFHTISLKKRRNEARFCTQQEMVQQVLLHAMTGLIRHFITYLLGTKAIFNRPFLKV